MPGFPNATLSYHSMGVISRYVNNVISKLILFSSSRYQFLPREVSNLIPYFLRLLPIIPFGRKRIDKYLCISLVLNAVRAYLPCINCPFGIPLNVCGTW